jgi:hypothetical protein
VKDSRTHNFDLGSYSSNNSFVDQGTPERKTPDLTHPYMQNQLFTKKKQSLVVKGQHSGSLSGKQKFISQALVESLGLPQ